jgi:hypothetical protein
MLIHVARDGRELGQFNIEELQERITEHSILPTDYAWVEGMESWQLIHQVFKIEWPRRQADAPVVPAHATSGSAKPKFLHGAQSTNKPFSW